MLIESRYVISFSLVKISTQRWLEKMRYFYLLLLLVMVKPVKGTIKCYNCTEVNGRIPANLKCDYCNDTESCFYGKGTTKFDDTEYSVGLLP